MSGFLTAQILCMTDTQLSYGTGDASFQAAGGEEGIFKLVTNFFDRMGSDRRFKTIYDMHTEPMDVATDKLARFLCGWLGGPKRYQEKYGSISIPQVHQHLPITADERDQWITCMYESISEQLYQDSFKEYLIQQLQFPAEVIRKRCEQN